MLRAFCIFGLAAAALLFTVAHGQEPSSVTVPLMLPPGSEYGQSLVRITNHDQENAVRITAVDDGGNVYDTVTVQLAADETLHFNSGDLADGNPAKGIEGIGAPIQGNWRLRVEHESEVGVRVQSYVSARDGFLTPMHDVLPSDETTPTTYYARTFNPASDATRQSRLRLINWGAEDETVRIEGVDDGGTKHGPVSLTLAAGQARMLTAIDLEEGAHGLEGALGDGVGKWNLSIHTENASALVAQSLLYSPSGHITNLSIRHRPRPGGTH